MKNGFFGKMTSKVKLNIKGKNIERFIKRLRSNQIDLLNITYLNYHEVNIVIYKKDYDKLIELKTIYDVTMVDIYGIIKIKEVVSIYKYVVSFIILGVALLIFLSHVIFNIEVIHTDSEIRNFLLQELENYGLKKYRLKKSYQEIQTIKNSILEKYKNEIEWLEIEESGTTYIVRLEERIIKQKKKEEEKQNVIASKSAVIKKIIAENGEVIRNINEYVNAGDVIISGNIYLNDEVKDTVTAKGVVYGEVWYNVSVEYPYIYSEIKEMNNYKDVFVLKLFSHNIEFTTKPYSEKRIEEKVLLYHPLLPISLVKQRQEEIQTISLVLTAEEAKEKAIIEAQKKMEEKLDDDERIIDYKVLKLNIKEDKIVLDVFFTVYENITGYSKIIEGDEIVP